MKPIPLWPLIFPALCIAFFLSCKHSTPESSLSLAPQEKAAIAAQHPEVDEEFMSLSCFECHIEYLPESAEAWLQSKHGINNVKCLVCHGSMTENFMAVPSTERCIGCHGGQVDSMDRGHMENKTCFSCHSPHSLNPHIAQGGTP